MLSAAPYGFIKLTPGQLDLITTMTDAAGARSLAGLLAVGADFFPAQSLQRWRALNSGTPVLNEYGPTEASVANAFFMRLRPQRLLPPGPGGTRLVLHRRCRAQGDRPSGWCQAAAAGLPGSGSADSAPLP